MSKRLFNRFRNRALMLLLGMGVGCSVPAWGQQPASYGRSTAIDQANSRAEQEAEQMVSLSADRILYILREEPGLLIQVKKALVRKAFEQGRLLNPQDLTDESVFRLIREDDSIRIIATREIEDRAYVRAKPTREEIARNLPCRQPNTAMTSETTGKPSEQLSPDAKRSPSQEQISSRKHETDLDCYLTQYLPDGGEQASSTPPHNTQAPQQPYPPAQYPRQPFPQSPGPQQQYPAPGAPQGPSGDYRRQPQLTQSQPRQGYFGVESDQSEMASIRPDELPGLLNASQTSRLSASSKNGMA